MIFAEKTIGVSQHPPLLDVPDSLDSSDKKNGAEKLSIEEIVQKIRSLADIQAFLQENFDAGDADIFLDKLQKHTQFLIPRPDSSYYQLLGLDLALAAGYQYPKVAFLNQAFAQRESTTGLDRFHPLLLVRSAVYLADITLQSYVLKEQIAHALEMRQHATLTESQQIVLASLCLGRNQGNFVVGKVEILKEGVINAEALAILQDVINDPQSGSSLLISRYRERTQNPGTLPYFAPELGLCLKLQSTEFSDRDAYNIFDGKATAESQQRLEMCKQVLQPMIDLTALFPS